MSALEIIASLAFGVVGLMMILGAIALWVGFQDGMQWRPRNPIYAYMDKAAALGERLGRFLRRPKNKNNY